MSVQALSPLDEAGVAATVGAARRAFAGASTLRELRSARLAHSNDTAPVAQANALIKGLNRADKPVAGRLTDATRKQVQAVLAGATARLEAEEAAAALEREKVDVTVFTHRNLRGACHPFTVLIGDVADLLIGTGREITEGPEVEHEWLSSNTLDFGLGHPAHQMQDTFCVSGVQTAEGVAVDVMGAPDAGATDGTGDVKAQPSLVLHIRTPPTQGREMLECGTPLYIAYSGKIFRADMLGAMHIPAFHQMEGLAVDKGLTMAHLKGMLDYLTRAVSDPETKARLRSSFFPFTESSAEMDLWFLQEKGGAGWVEWGGCGMVNPEVLCSAGIDPDEYTGFAFGMGPERILMFRHGITDMRDMVEGDVRLSPQFGTTGRGS